MVYALGFTDLLPSQLGDGVVVVDAAGMGEFMDAHKRADSENSESGRWRANRTATTTAAASGVLP